MATNDLRERFPLYTITQVAELFPVGGSIEAREAAVRMLVAKIGCGRLFGGQLLMTEQDIADLLEAIRLSGGLALEPSEGEAGHLVVVGSNSCRDDASCFIGWASFGCVQSLINEVRSYTSYDVDLIDAVPCSHSEYKRHLTALSKHRVRGYWHKCAPELRAYIGALTALHSAPTSQ